MSLKFSKKIDIHNRKASFEYFFLDTFTAGMVLRGTEIKSIRLGKVSMSDAYCFFSNEELYLKHLNIGIYENGTYLNHDPLRERKLLLTKKELKKLVLKLNDKGLTLIPTRLFIDDNGFAKLEIALAKGKKLYDKRDSIKERDVSRDQLRGE